AGSTSLPNSANNYKHTQSPLLTAANGLVGGGLNDRFDIIFSTAAFNDGAGLAIITGTYRSLGNDSMHYNQAINNGNNSYYPTNIPRSNALAANLVIASDHVPLIADYQIPAVMSASLPATFGRVIQGAAYAVTLNVR